MSDEKKPGFWDSMQNTYRLVLMNEETFEEMGSYKLTRLNIYLGFSTLIVGVAVLVASLIIFTPIKRYIPGYGDVILQDQVIDLSKRVDSMQMALNAYQLYEENIRKIIHGDYELPPDTIVQEDFPDSLLNTSRSVEDSLLRVEIAKENLMQLTYPKSGGIISQKKLEDLYFFPPVNGTISAEFDPEKDHFGLDIVAPENTPIKAIQEGIVIAADWTLATGNTIGIQHNNNLLSFYKHNSVLLKKVGSFVKAGEAIAIIGNTGELTDGPHLHLELWHNKTPVDPNKYINF